MCFLTCPESPGRRLSTAFFNSWSLRLHFYQVPRTGPAGWLPWSHPSKQTLLSTDTQPNFEHLAFPSVPVEATALAICTSLSVMSPREWVVLKNSLLVALNVYQAVLRSCVKTDRWYGIYHWLVVDWIGNKVEYGNIVGIGTEPHTFFFFSF